ncbi:uncharacterized protein LOC119279930 [Triticum dicoccoides]|uniref:uncharacterized protein LOC119279930 n=1 Tax=Triticum dicoccoides TaxID=85692 RepID=UPI00188F6CB3|nr:uncharacterized protein LOC119279930 [Triticum dicoccoides]
MRCSNGYDGANGYVDVLMVTGPEKSCAFPPVSRAHPVLSSTCDLPLSAKTPVPRLTFRHLSPCARWHDWARSSLADPGFAPVLRAAGVHDAIAASTAAVAPDRHALSALLSLWHPGSHAFRLPAGPATFSLEDALLLAGLAPSGAPLDRPLTPTEQDIRARLVVEKEKIQVLHPCARKARRVSAEVWLEWFESRIRPGEDDELRRLGFLAYWLAFFVAPRLRSKGAELPERVFALAARISLGERIALGPAVVANLYAEMDRIVTTGVQEGASGRVDVWAPLWLLQVWLWERYDRLQPPELKAPEFPLSNVRALYWSRRRRKTTEEEALRVLQEEDSFEWRPYLRNSLDWAEPEWFSKETILVSSRGKDMPEWLEDYIAIMRQAVLTGSYGDDMDSSAMYNPHIIARQLGYDQDVPFPLVHGFDSKGIKVWVPGICRRGVASKEYVAWLNGEFVTHQEADRFVRPVDEIGAGSSPMNADTAAGKSGESTMQDNRKRVGEGQQLAQGNKAEVIVLDRSSPCDMDSSATAVKRKNGNRKRRDELSENGDMRKKSKVFASECHEGLQQYDDGPSIVGYPEKNSLQFDGQKYHGLQNDPNCDINRCDELPQPESDDECIVLEPTCEVINLDDDQEDEDRQLVLVLQEFVRCGLFSQWEESSDEDEDEGGEGKKETPKRSDVDPYAEAAMREYPRFFEFIPQRPHYRGLVNTSDTIRDLVCSGLWFMLVGLAREVLKTSCDTEALEVAYLMRKARQLERNGFNVKHLIARLREPQARLRRLEDSRARLEDARTKEQEPKDVKSLSSHLCNLKHNVLTMQRHLEGKKQARSASVRDESSEGIDLASLEKEVEAAEKYCQAMKDEVAAMRLKYAGI